MGLNPIQIIKLKDTLNAFRNRHPGFAAFLRAVRDSGVSEGSVLDMKITSPEGKVMTTNFRVSEEDLELLRVLMELRK
ncbi:MAG: hypothetical protein Q4D81_09905 [Eubacteriales bacterium]|nr:hypothetical protein [Eubacteriales bacterium]